MRTITFSPRGRNRYRVTYPNGTLGPIIKGGSLDKFRREFQAQGRYHPGYEIAHAPTYQDGFDRNQRVAYGIDCPYCKHSQPASRTPVGDVRCHNCRKYFMPIAPPL